MPHHNSHLIPTSVAHPATPEDMTILAAKLRPECARELKAATGFDPAAVLAANIPSTFVIKDRMNQPIATLAVIPVPDAPRQAVLQVTVSEAVTKLHRARHLIIHTGDAVLALHRAGYDTIHSFVDARNISTATLLTGPWLAALGLCMLG